MIVAHHHPAGTGERPPAAVRRGDLLGGLLPGLLRLLLAAATATLLPAGVARADSIFSANGMGEVIHATDVRGRGMGGVAIAVDDPANLSPLNPALLANVQRLTLHFEAVPEFRRIEDHEGRIAATRSTNFPLLRLALRVPRLGVLGVGIEQTTDVTYELGERQSVEGLEFQRTLEGKNGWNAVALSFGRQLGHGLKAGLDVRAIIGSYSDIWTSGPAAGGDFNTTVDSLVVNHSRGPRLRAGVLWAPSARLRLGATLTPGRTIEIRSELRNARGSTHFARRRLDLPLALGAGASFVLHPHWLLASDLLYTRWEDTDLTLSRDNVESRNVTRLGLGVEYEVDRSGATRSVLDSIAWRAGYSREPWHYRDPGGEDIVDHFLGLGAGIPFRDQAGQLDLSVEFGTRGDIDRNLARERVLRIGIGLTVGEVVKVGRVR